MYTLHPTQKRNMTRLINILIWVTLGFGFILTYISWMQICKDACVATQGYTYFRLSFEMLGFAFFGLFSILHFLSYSFPQLFFLECTLLAVASGSELAFIFTQKWIIHEWCPICLSIGAVIFALSILFIIRSYKNSSLKFFTLSLSFLFGLLLSALGVMSPNSLVEGQHLGDLKFGNKNATVEVYIVTDWFCLACRKMETYLEKMYPKMMDKASLVFIDKTIHPNSLNYTPYNLSFMLYNKKEYFALRQTLIDLAKKTKAPTVEEVENAIKSLGVTYKPLQSQDVDRGLKYFEEIANIYKVNMTPTVVIANKKTRRAEKLTGSLITEANLFNAIDKMSNLHPE